MGDDSDMIRADMALLEEGADDAPPKDDEPPETPEGVEPPVEPEEEEKKGGEEKGEEEEKEEKVEEDKEEKVVSFRHRPTVRDITTKFPEFFKTFPDMRHVLFREGEYANIFPTIDDAKEASQTVENYNHLSDLVSSGKREDFTEFLKGINEADSLSQMASNFLPSLHEVNSDLYYRVTQPILESILRNAYKTGLDGGNDNLKNAALHVARWALGDPAYATGEKKSEPIKIDTPKSSDLDRERAEFYTQKYNDAKGYVDSTASSRLYAEVKRGFDPNNILPQATVDLWTKHIVEEIDRSLVKDERHMKAINSMWKRAHAAGYAGDWKDRILSSYLSAARALMPAIRAKARATAFGSQRQLVEENERQARKSEGRKDVSGSANSQGVRGAKPINPKTIDWEKTSDLDILNDNVTYRK